MRLSTEPDRDEARGIEVLHAAFDSGITLVDTADAYCRDETEAGHNERLIRRALEDWSGDRGSIRIATKGGLTRPDGAWVADGRARHLVSACEASRRALGVDRIHLYQLHAPDPRVPLSTSVRALDGLKRDGLIEHIGLCNVTVGQIGQARAVTEIAAVQVELSIWHDEALLNGVVEYCVANKIQLLAHRPLGGVQRKRRVASDPVLVQVAERHGVTPFEIALAWLRDLSPLVLPLPGATTIERVRSIVRAAAIVLTDQDRTALDERCPAGRRAREGSSRRQPPQRAHREVVLVMGLPAAGKSTVAAAMVDQGYVRLNRDDSGGSLRRLNEALDQHLASGGVSVVADNTYVTRHSRGAVIDAAWKHGASVRCIWLSTSIEDAQVNAVERMLARYGRLLTPEEIRRHSKRDPSVFGPSVQFRYQRELEPPDMSEGFSQIEVRAFERRLEPRFSNRAVIVWCDGVNLVERGDVLRRFALEGWKVLVLSWQPGLADDTISVDQVDAEFARLRAALGFDLEVAYCPHTAGPPICWCRKPLPGLGLVFIRRHQLDPSQCIYVGAGSLDPGFARRLGFSYREAEDFFA